MRDIRKELFEYLDIKQHIWNCYFVQKFRGLNECEPLDSFELISARLFFVLVSKQLDLNLPPDYKLGTEYIEKIIVRPKRGSKTIAVMVSKSKSTMVGTSFDKAQLNVDGLQLAFIDFFQWDRYNFLSSSVVRCKIVKAPRDPAHKNHDALVEARDVDFFLASKMRM